MRRTVSAAPGSSDGLGPRAGAQAPGSPATKNCVGKAKKAKIQSYVVLLRLHFGQLYEVERDRCLARIGPQGRPSGTLLLTENLV